MIQNNHVDLYVTFLGILNIFKFWTGPSLFDFEHDLSRPQGHVSNVNNTLGSTLMHSEIVPSLYKYYRGKC